VFLFYGRVGRVFCLTVVTSVSVKKVLYRLQMISLTQAWKAELCIQRDVGW
jgi:hypothetical protein